MSKIIDKDKILVPFINEPNREFHLREIARLTKVNPTTASKYLEGFKADKLVLRRRERGNIIYKGNDDNTIFKDTKLFHNILKIRKSGLIDHINYEFNFPNAIILFGSYAKGENIKGSDIDLFIYTESEKELNLSRFEQELKAKIQLFCYNKKELEILKQKNKELVNSIINGMSLSGYFELLT